MGEARYDSGRAQTGVWPLMVATLMRLFSMFMVALVVVMVAIMVMFVGGPGRKWIGQMSPTLGASGHFVSCEQTRIEL